MKIDFLKLSLTLHVALHDDMTEKVPGYVYILTNPSFREDWVKIGKSTRPVDVRSKELDNTAVPLPFEIFATMRTVKYNEVEKLVHKTIDRLTDLRIRQNREFFNVAPQVALDILKDIAQTIDDAVITEYKDNKPIEEGAAHHDEDESKRTVKRSKRPSDERPACRLDQKLAAGVAKARARTPGNDYRASNALRRAVTRA